MSQSYLFDAVLSVKYCLNVSNIAAATLQKFRSRAMFYKILSILKSGQT